MAETIGTLVDKISITQLKVFNMQKQLERTDATEDHRRMCASRVEILKQQRDDLVEELNQLFSDVISGKKTIKVYRQFKMYNDPVYRSQQTPTNPK